MGKLGTEKSEQIEFYILLVTVILGGIISVFDLTGIWDSITWLKVRIPTITLLLTTLIAGSLLMGTYNIRQFLKTILPTGTFLRLDSDNEYAHYTLNRIKSAKKSVYDLTWADPLQATLTLGDQDIKEYYKLIEDVSKHNIKYREIMMFCDRDQRISKARRLISHAGIGYQLAVYADLPKNSPPRWQFVIIDEEEVILKGLAVKQPEIVDYFCRYYAS